jgi:membrane protease YdiL (CAAX protease family)
MSQDLSSAEQLPPLERSSAEDTSSSLLRLLEGTTGLAAGRAILGLMFLGVILWIVFLDPRTGEPPPWTGWTLRDVLLIFLAWFSLGGLAHLVWYFATHEIQLLRNRPIHRLTNNLGRSTGEVLALLLAVGVFGLRVRGQGWEALGLVPMSWDWLLLTLAVGLGIGPVLVLSVLVLYRRSGTAFQSDQLDYILPPRVPGSGEALGPGVYALGVLTMVLLAGGVAPLAEEVLFRGILYPWLAGWLGVVAAMGLSSAAFGLVHLSWGIGVAAVNGVIGLILVLMLQGSGSLWSAVLIHMLLNSSRFVLAGAGRAGWFDHRPADAGRSPAPEPSPDPETIPSGEQV